MGPTGEGLTFQKEQRFIHKPTHLFIILHNVKEQQNVLSAVCRPFLFPSATLAAEMCISLVPLLGGASNHRVYYWAGPGGADDQGRQRLRAESQTGRHPHQRLGYREPRLRRGVSEPTRTPSHSSNVAFSASFFSGRKINVSQN